MNSVPVKCKIETKVEIDYDDALNEAGWVLLDEIGKFQKVEGHLFNNMKGCLKAAIEKYLAEQLKQDE